MSGFEGPVLKGMNPFSNNQPRLTASERIRNKRDATIYQAEKQRFQNKKTCGNKNVKYYDNGTIRSMKSYKLQKSLARGNVLCEDCNDKGLLCNGPANKDALASIQMSNNVVSEYWGGSSMKFAGGSFIQEPGFPVIKSDISGTWDPNVNYKGNISPGCIDCSYGYIDNLISIPRNLDGSGITIDPSNELFPDELCDPFRYLKHTNLSTYVVARMLVSLEFGGGAVFRPSNCNDISYNSLIGAFAVAHGGSSFLGSGPIFSGEISSLCCVREVTLIQEIELDGLPIITMPPGTYGIFDVYIKLFNIGNYIYLSALLNTKTTGSAGKWDWGSVENDSFDLVFQRGYEIFSPGAKMQVIESFKIIQGTIPPSTNQTKYNATRQSYMSCLENGTRKINFTKNTVQQNNVITAYCTKLCSPTTISYSITTSGGGVSIDTISVPGYTIYTFDTQGTLGSLIVDISSMLVVDGLALV